MTPNLQQHSQPSVHGKLYTAFGLLITSELSLPDLYLAPIGTDSPDVTVRLGEFPAHNPVQPGFTVLGKAATLIISNVGRYWINEGREIVIDPAPGVSQRNLRLYLLGSAFGALLHQRRVLPLHANAIEVGGKAIAFCGQSGAGKSTLAAWFHDRGYRMISDDVCAVTFANDGRPFVQGGLPRLRLCRDALIASGRSVEDFEKSYDGVDKFDVPASSSTDFQPTPLAAVYVLGRTDLSIKGEGITQLSGIDAVEALVTNTYRGAFARDMGEANHNLTSCLSLIRSIPLFTANREWGFDLFERETLGLEQHALKIVSANL